MIRGIRNQKLQKVRRLLIQLFKLVVYALKELQEPIRLRMI